MAETAPLTDAELADRVAALRVALNAGPHPDAADLPPHRVYGSDDPLPPGAAEQLAARGPELTERARRLGLA